MKQSQLSFTLCMAILLSAGSAIESRKTFADNVTTYWGSSSGEVWKSGSNKCWQGKNGNVDMACNGVVEAPVVAEEDTAHYWLDDQDYDGVVDGQDHCPSTPEGVTVDSNGCAIDSDGDGVPDYLDQCPGTPLGAIVDLNGCPYTILKLSDVHFAFDSALLSSEAKSLLNGAISAINANPSTVSVEGYTDDTGSDEYNLGLSQRRAQSVVDYLVSQGVDSSKLKAVGYGETSLTSSNATREGRSQNRRVEIRNR